MKSLLAIPFLMASSHAATLIYDDFSGNGAAGLHGTSPDTNTISSATWVASTIILNNGQVNDGTNTDRGATIDLGPGFVFETDKSYTLTVSWANLDNAILFAGFSTAAMNVEAVMQTQPDNFAVRIRDISPDAGIAAWTRMGATNTPTLGAALDPSGSGTTTMTITTNSVTNATFAVNGVSSTAINLTGYRYLYLGFEDPTALSPASDVRFTSVEFAVVPEPAAATLGVFGLLGLLRRRR
jgi:hypothetical protein